jgi:hypothetical protein
MRRSLVRTLVPVALVLSSSRAPLAVAFQQRQVVREAAAQSAGGDPAVSRTRLAAVVEKDTNPLSYYEKSRRDRRDFFTHESWVGHRDKARFVSTLLKIPESRIIQALFQELLFSE